MPSSVVGRPRNRNQKSDELKPTRALEINQAMPTLTPRQASILLMQRRYDKAVANTGKAVRNWRLAQQMQRNLPASFSRRRDIPKKRSYRARKRSPLTRTIPQCIRTLLEMPMACRGAQRKRLPAWDAYHARSPGFGLFDIVMAYQETRKPKEARQTAEQLMAARPNFTIGGWLKTQFIRRDTARVEAGTAALRAAGLPMG